MKKIRKILAVVTKTAILFLPGIAVFMWLLDTHGLPVAALAALGVEFITGLIITFLITLAAQIKSRLDIKKDQ